MDLSLINNRLAKQGEARQRKTSRQCAGTYPCAFPSILQAQLLGNLRAVLSLAFHPNYDATCNKMVVLHCNYGNICFVQISTTSNTL